MNTVLLTQANLEIAITALASGKIVGLPTETVYGLAGAIDSDLALNSIFSAKERPQFDPLIVHIANEPQWKRVVHEPSLSKLSRNVLTTLRAKYWPGPLTLLVPKSTHVPDLVTAGSKLVAVRMPNSPLFLEILTKLNIPLAAPSANRFGRTSPTLAQHVLSELNGRIPFIVDGGPCGIGIESSIVHVHPVDGTMTLLRAGGLSLESLQETSQELGLGEVLYQPRTSSSSNPGGISDPVTPGSLESHYAPNKRLYRFETPLHTWDEAKLTAFHRVIELMKIRPGLLTCFRKSEEIAFFRYEFIDALRLSENPQFAAPQFFSTLRAVDDSPAPYFFVDPYPTDQGLGLAIQDRLCRASELAQVSVLAD